MAWIEKVFNKPVENTIHPELLITIEFNLDSNNEVLTEFSGVLTDTNGKRLAGLHNWSAKNPTKQKDWV
ncbi:MAG: hypothetical protein U5K71_09250 [Gracilimonas sp.]|nr:hypothetical protein [Gracilimonas sp.]